MTDSPMTSPVVCPPLKTGGSGHSFLIAGLLGFSAFLTLLDMVTPFNVSTSYALPALLYVLLMRKRLPLPLAFIWIAFSLLAYFIKPLPETPPLSLERILHMRMINRLMVVGVILGIVLWSNYFGRLIQSSLQFTTRCLRPDTTPDYFDTYYNDHSVDYFDAIDRGIVLLTGIGVVLSVVLLDLYLPALFNPTILLLLPLIYSAWTCNFKLLWGFALVLLIWPFVGLVFDFPWIQHHNNYHLFLGNRIIPVCTGLILAVILHQWMSRLIASKASA